MRDTRIALPELALIGVTRGMLGVGFGLLVAERVPRKQRQIVGIALAAIGALSTIPLAIRVFRRRATDARATVMAD
jgi:hypothetical protein